MKHGCFKLLSNLRNRERFMEKEKEKQFNVGDLVWAKVNCYPWWPSIIYDEALTSSHVQQANKEGLMLVSFFGDNSYNWLDPKKLLHFESNFSMYSNRSSSRLFLKAVNEAVYEINHRAALGLTCPCLFFSSYRPAPVEGFLEVDIDGYSTGGVYSVQQIEGFRQEFQPLQTLSFVQQLALDPTNVHQDPSLLKEVARVLAFRKAKYAEIDEPYFLAFGVHPQGLVDPSMTSNQQETTLLQAPAPVDDEKKPTIKLQNKKKRRLATPKPNATKTSHKVKRNLHHDSQDDVPEKKRQVKVEIIDKKLDIISTTTTSDDKQQPQPEAATTTTTTKRELPLKKRQRRRSVSSIGCPKLALVLSSKRERERKKEEKSGISIVEKGPKMVLSMKFPPDAALPSVSELKAKFAKFGPMEISGVHVSYLKSRCQVVFMNKPDAQKAYEHVVKFKNMFGQTHVFYRLHPFGNSIKEAKEGSKETALVTSSHMQQVNQETTYANKYQKAAAAEVNQGGVDISDKMLYLLNECSRIVFELKQF
ncbi:unnamed protein product [Lactuca virosa]|uniref:PWWP domain-containing protein n=1 Tax=Lactuca virosa TaxID=75947 RepID=A0AAU9LWJ3_9ASTR|nr:unnamed protein product [Lactuca virosa]